MERPHAGKREWARGLGAIVAAAGARHDVVGRKGETALGEACSQAKQETVAVLLGAGADPNQECGEGDVPLQRAARKGRVEAAKSLVAAGAKVDVVDEQGNSPLVEAAKAGAVGIVDLLLAHGANPKKRNERGVDAYDIAVRNDRDDCRERLFIENERRELGEVGSISAADSTIKVNRL